MAAVSCVTAVWNFGTGAPGTTKLWFQELLDASARQAAVDSVRSLLFPVGSYMQTSMNIQTGTTIQNFDLDTGKLVNEVTAGTLPPPVVGTQLTSEVFAGGVGARVLWRTGVVIGGRKVVGRTFLAPLVKFSTAQGAVSTTLINSMKTAINTYIAQSAARPVVWHKHFGVSPGPGQPPPYLGGNAVPINQGDVLATVSSLRSRRY